MSQNISSNPIPLHVAIVPDGNRRWAKKRGLKPWEGHEAGADMIEKISREAHKMGIKYITFWGSSVDNLTKRPLEEKHALLKIYERYFKRLINSQDIYDNQTRINIFGRWEEQFPHTLQRVLKDGIERTKQHANNFLNFLLAYNGDDELLEVMKRVIDTVRNNYQLPKSMEKLLRDKLMTGSLPDVDLLIRTGVEDDPHNSAGFMMWQTRNSQYYFTEKMFPEFDVAEFKKAIEDFSNRVRRFGK